MANYLTRRRSAALEALSETLRVAADTAAEIAARSLPGSTWLARPLHALSDTITPEEPRPVLRLTQAAAKKKAHPGEVSLSAESDGEAGRRRAFREKTAEHRARIGESIRARWADPEYAERVRTNMRLAAERRMGTREDGVLVDGQDTADTQSELSASTRRRKAADGGASSMSNGAVAQQPRQQRAASRRPAKLTAKERSTLAAQAHAMLAQAQAAADALEAAAAGGAPVDPAVLAEVHAAVATAREVLARVSTPAPAALGTLAEPDGEKWPRVSIYLRDAIKERAMREVKRRQTGGDKRVGSVAKTAAWLIDQHFGQHA
jgi:hypothetical protein